MLSWEDVAASGRLEGYNVVIHEMAHKLDMLNGDANGFPPLHADMDSATWYRVFSEAFEDLDARVEAGEETEIDEYAAEEPGEFFAVTSEYFFEAPDVLGECYPKVYAELRAFYRQTRCSASRRSTDVSRAAFPAVAAQRSSSSVSIESGLTCLTSFPLTRNTTYSAMFLA